MINLGIIYLVQGQKTKKLVNESDISGFINNCDLTKKI